METIFNDGSWIELNKMSDYQKRQNACNCISQKRRGFIQAALDQYEDLPDGAFFAALQDSGIDIDELEPFSIKHNCKNI